MNLNVVLLVGILAQDNKFFPILGSTNEDWGGVSLYDPALKLLSTVTFSNALETVSVVAVGLDCNAVRAGVARSYILCPCCTVQQKGDPCPSHGLQRKSLCVVTLGQHLLGGIPAGHTYNWSLRGDTHSFPHSDTFRMKHRDKSASLSPPQQAPSLKFLGH